MPTFNSPANKAEWQANQYHASKQLDSLFDKLTPKERDGVLKLARFHASHYIGDSPTGHKFIGRYLVSLAESVKGGD